MINASSNAKLGQQRSHYGSLLQSTIFLALASLLAWAFEVFLLLRMASCRMFRKFKSCILIVGRRQ